MVPTIVYQCVKIVGKIRVEILTSRRDAAGCGTERPGFGSQPVAVDREGLEMCRGSHHLAMPQVPAQRF